MITQDVCDLFTLMSQQKLNTEVQIETEWLWNILNVQQVDH